MLLEVEIFFGLKTIDVFSKFNHAGHQWKDVGPTIKFLQLSNK